MVARSTSFGARVAMSCTVAWVVAVGCSPLTSVSPRDTPHFGGSGVAGLAAGSRPSTGGWSNFYPLAQGNRWSYDREFTLEVVAQGLPPDRFVYRSKIEVEQTCRETIEGRSYQIERHHETSEDGDDFLSWWRLRQDRDGLYEYDLEFGPICEPAAAARRQRFSESTRDPGAELAARIPEHRRWVLSAAIGRQQERIAAVRSALGMTPSGVASDEIQRLAYPLHTGAEWVLRKDPLFSQRVEGVDPFRTPMGTLVGYRIDLVWEDFLGPNDRVSLWYGRQGKLGHDFHFEDEATDDSGSPMGMLIAKDRQTLTGLYLVNSPRFSAAL